MTRMYFERTEPKVTDKVFNEYNKLRKKFNIYHKSDFHEDGSVTFKMTSVNEKTQKILNELGFELVKVEEL